MALDRMLLGRGGKTYWGRESILCASYLVCNCHVSKIFMNYHGQGHVRVMS